MGETRDEASAGEPLTGANAYNRRLIEASLDPLVTIGPDGRITDVNTATEQVTGCPRAALVGTDFSDYFTEPDRAREGYQRAFREGFVRDYPLEIRHTDGRLTAVLYNASTYRDEQGEVIGVFAAARDVTDRRRAEEALRIANAYNRSLIEASLDPLVTIGPDGKITDVNSATEQVTGCPRDALIGTDFSDYFTEPGKARDGYQQVFREGLVRDYALELRHRDGHVTPVLYNASTYRDEQGEVIGVFAAARDVSERRRAEQRMLEEMKLRLEKERLLVHQSRLAAMGEMIGAIAHQWRQPLNGVASILQDVKGAFAAGVLDKPYLDGAVGAAITQVRYMSKTIDDFRNFFRPDKAKTWFLLRPAIEQAVGMLAPQLTSHAIVHAIVSSTPEVPIRTFGHENEMKQVFLNLITNAKDAIEERRKAGHPIEGRIEIGIERDAGTVVVRVSDDGGGIPPEILDRVFEPYFTTKEPGRGTGIGLYMARTIVENAGGRLLARNVGPGAELRVEMRDES